MCEEVGDAILANAWTGYNATLFAYGQTGQSPLRVVPFAPVDGVMCLVM